MTRHWRCAILTGALMLLAQLAHAQYSWLDEKGTRVFSDRPPPPGTPATRILQMPRSAAPAMPAGDAAKPPSSAAPGTSATSAATATARKPPTLAEQETAFRERQAKREEAARKTQEAAEQKAALDERCASARQEERMVTSGTRMSALDAKGERYFLSNEERARRLRAARRALQDCR